MDSFDLEIFWGLVRTIVVLALLAPAVYGVTRWFGKRQQGSTTIRIQENLSLGSNRGLYVIEWEGERLLLGVTNESIQVLKKTPITTEKNEVEAVE